FKALGGRWTMPLLVSELLSEYIDWLEELREANDEARTAFDISMHDVLSGVDEQTADFIANVRRMASLRVLISVDRGDLLISFAERDWGKAVLRFPGAVLSEDIPMPLPCYLCSVQGERDGDVCRFFILGDTEFSQGDYVLRALRSDNWQQVVFTSGLPELELRLYDYPERIRLSGASGIDYIQKCSAALVGKELVCGDSALSSGERQYLCAAGLFDGLSQIKSMRRRDDVDRVRPQILSSLDDRYSCAMLADRFSKIAAGKVAEPLRNACQRLVDGDADGALRDAVSFYRLLCESFSRTLSFDEVRSLVSDMSGMVDIEQDETALETAAWCVEDAVAPELERLGFAGEYPHYQRTVGQERQYVSFLLRPQSDRAFKGVYGFELNLACARTFDRLARDFAKGDEICAPDCKMMRYDRADYTELCSADDNDPATVSVSTIGGFGAVFDDEHVLSRLTLAGRVMRGAKLPAQYAARRHRARGFWRNLLAAAADSAYLLALVSVLLLGAYLALRSRVELLSSIQAHTAALIALGASFGVFVLASVRTYFTQNRKFWRRR
ncbi:MAG: hypothetical protein J6S41_06405, partial [Clostridia bacterium]|nr:hypothetical protein [Clostridia bacterium]